VFGTTFPEVLPLSTDLLKNGFSGFQIKKECIVTDIITINQQIDAETLKQNRNQTRFIPANFRMAQYCCLNDWSMFY